MLRIDWVDFRSRMCVIIDFLITAIWGGMCEYIFATPYSCLTVAIASVVVKSTLTTMVLKGFRNLWFVAKCFEPGRNSIFGSMPHVEKYIPSHIEILEGLLCQETSQIWQDLERWQIIGAWSTNIHKMMGRFSWVTLWEKAWPLV